MRVVVAVVVYNRAENIVRWTECWRRSNVSEAQLVVIHNHSTHEDYDYIKRITCSVGGAYVPRHNVGFDIGAMQDVARQRLVGFPYDYEYILWCTDDTLPMRPDFIWTFLEKIYKERTSLVCMELSKEVRLHVRTTGFMVSKETLEALRFPADPITTKQQCYDFEHRGGAITILEQAQARGEVVQVRDIEESPLWDTGHRARAAIRRERRRRAEFFAVWSAIRIQEDIIENPLVVVICPVYNTFPQIITSMLAQTHRNWKLRMIHDGHAGQFIGAYLGYMISDPRITFENTEKRSGNWGHTIRRDALQKGDLGQYVVITNADNYHVPTYLEFMLKGFNEGIVATYCSHMVHNYKAHQIIDCRLQRGFIDCAGVMVRSRVAKEIGWTHVNDHSADWLYFKDIIDVYGEHAFKKVEGCLLIHN